MTAQEDQWIRLIKNRLNQISNLRQTDAEVGLASDEAYEKIERLETVLKERN